MNEMSFYVERLDLAQSMARFYWVGVEPTLFGDWVTVCWWGGGGSVPTGGGRSSGTRRMARRFRPPMRLSGASVAAVTGHPPKAGPSMSRPPPFRQRRAGQRRRVGPSMTSICGDRVRGPAAKTPGVPGAAGVSHKSRDRFQRARDPGCRLDVGCQKPAPRIRRNAVNKPPGRLPCHFRPASSPRSPL